jgi:8-oxo-dGTP pyrophosphatase MutT (NUDIX family)
MVLSRLVPPQRLKPVAGAVVRLALDRAPVEPAVQARGAGIAYVDPDGRALFLKRGAGGDHAGKWCFPGGGIEVGETPEAAAVRESREEIGANPYGARSLMSKTAMDGGHFLTYAQPVKHAFTPRLNEEHTEHTWAPLGQPPQPLHPGVRQALSGIAMDEWSEGDHPRASNGQFGTGAFSVVRSAHEKATGQPKSSEAKIADLFANSLGMKRADMPQVPGDHKEAFLSELRGKTTLTPEMVKASTLKPTQEDYKADQVEAMAAAGVDPTKGNILVSSDGYVLDGHHRWAAAALNGGDISTIKVDLPIKDLLKAAEDFNQRSGVERRTLDTPSTAQAHDADFDESKHPRADNGQFGHGQGGMSPAVDPKPRAEISTPAPASYRQGMPEAPKAPAAAAGARREGPSGGTAPAPKSPDLAAAPPKPKHAPLSPDQKAIESRMAASLGQEFQGTDQDGNSVYKTTDPEAYRRAVAAYAQLEDAEGGKVINTDVARELSPDYMKDRTQAAAVHEPSSQFIKDRYAEMLAQPPAPGELPMVLFTAGGAGAGKSTAIKGVKDVADLKAKAQIVYDTNLDGYSSGKKKIEQALAAGKQVNIAMIVRDPEDALVAGALKRAEAQRKKFGTGRTVPLATHIKTHQGAVETVNRLAMEYADHQHVQIHIIDNTHGFGKAKQQSVEWLKSVAYNDIEGRVKKALEREHDEGRISHETYRGFAGSGAAHDEADRGHLARGPGAVGRIQPQPGRSPGGKPEPPGSRQAGPIGADGQPAAAPSGAVVVSDLAQDEEHWITVNGGEGKGTPLLITGGGVVVGGAGGNLNGKVLDPKSKSAPRASEPTKASKSADIAKALQNRNRSSAASVAQMNRIASNPNPRLMMAAPTMNDGAPVVTDLEGKGIAKLTGHRDWVVTGKREIPVRYAVVEADQLAASNRADGTKNEDYAKNPDKLVAINNGRTAAMIEAYSRGTADAYKAAIAKAERVHGIPGKDIKAMKAPVLVRIMDAADVDERIGDESNSTQTLSLSAVEQAQNDATRFDPAGIEYDDDGTPSDASVKGFINAMPAAERQSLSPNGKPTKQAIDRMLAATFHAAYGDSELVGLMAQATDPESRNLINGMSKAAGSMAKLKDAGELDIRELVTGAAKQIINAVRSGVSIKKFLKQGDLLTNSAEDQIAALFAENSRSAKAIGEKLTAAANFAYEESQKEGTDMFGDPIPQASREDALEKLHAQS